MTTTSQAAESLSGVSTFISPITNMSMVAINYAGELSILQGPFSGEVDPSTSIIKVPLKSGAFAFSSDIYSGDIAVGSSYVVSRFNDTIGWDSFGSGGTITVTVTSGPSDTVSLSGSYSFVTDSQYPITVSGQFTTSTFLEPSPDLTATFSNEPAPLTLSPGDSSSGAGFTISNSTSNPATGSIAATFQLVPVNSSTNNGQPVNLPDATVTAPITNDVTVPSPVPVNFTVPAGTPGGDYRLVGTLSETGITDSNTADKTFQSFPLTILGGGLVSNNFLSPSIHGPLPSTTLVAGQKIPPIRQTIVLKDAGTINFKGPVTFSVLLSPDKTGTSGGDTVLTFTRNVNLHPGGSVAFPATFSSIPLADTGTLYLIAEASDIAGNTAFSPSAGTITVAAPFVDLTGVVTHVPAMVSGKHTGVVTLQIINDGNVAAAGNLAIDLQASPDGTLASATADLGTVTRHVSILPGHRLTLQLPETFPATGGTYYVVANLDPNDTFADSNLTNNIFASTTAVKIV
jgi:hypothetical protein